MNGGGGYSSFRQAGPPWKSGKGQWMQAERPGLFPRLMEPGFIGGKKLRNRVIMAPMGMFGLPGKDGELTREGVEFYRQRACGGAALVFPAAALVTTGFEPPSRALYAFESMDKAPAWSMLAELVHHHGAALGIQLSAGLGRASVGTFFDPLHVPVSASAVSAHWVPWIDCRALEKHEIEGITAAFGRAAAMAAGCGIDVIEIHGYGGYLLDQFMTGVWNRRDDEYGGTLENRMRFPLEVLGAVKAACGRLPVVFKMSVYHGIEGGREPGEALEIATILEDAGVDALHFDTGCSERWNLAIPPVYEPAGTQLQLTGTFAGSLGIPVIVNGKLGIPEAAESALVEGKAGFIALGRAHLADPGWALKVREGIPEEIVPCIGCNEGCMARGFTGRYASCAVNPSCAMEGHFHLTQVAPGRRILVIGGGPAGMSAAITAAKRGFSVEIWEAGARLGGRLLEAGAPPFKRDLRRLLDYLTGQVDKLGISISLGVRADASMAAAARPDAVIAATGAVLSVPDIPGVETALVAGRVLLGEIPSPGRVVVAGGGIAGCETALFLAGKGREVLVIDREEILSHRQAFTINRDSLMSMLKASGVKLAAPAELTGITPGGAEIRSTTGQESIPAGGVVLATGLEPDTSLARGLPEELAVRVVGDAAGPRKVLDALWEGFHAARLLQEKGWT